jgi:hypothetical protein
VPEPARPLIARCLARSPADRHPTTSALRLELAVLRRAFADAGPAELATWVAA